MSNEEQSDEWSIEQWQCGIGITETCVDKDLLWDEPSSWRTLVDEIVPMTEVLIVVGVQYISSQIGPGTTKGINSLRCMINNLGSNTWAFGAGAWQALLYFEAVDSIRPYMATGYQYACTCLWDANGIKKMLGLTDESNSDFASCSEEASNNTVRANNAKADREQERREAAKQSIFDAAKNKVINDTANEMKEINSCSLLTDPPAGPTDIECMGALNVMRKTNEINIKYWANMVASTGGPEGTKNKDEQTKLETALWTELGIFKGLYEIYPNRYNEEGVMVASCVDAAGTSSYGSACELVLSTYADLGTPTPYFAGDVLNEEANVYCFEENDNGNTRLTGTTSCDPVPMLNGYSQWQDKSQITCQNPGTFVQFSGIENCMLVAGEWLARDAYTNVDQPRFRTLGEIVPDQVQEDDISCLSTDFVTVRTGSTDCYAYWLTGQGINGIDQYVWLTTQGITCGDGLSGLENCQASEPIKCTAGKTTRLSNSDGSLCIPSFTWSVKED